MKPISFLIKPASSGCDLRCKYCFYADVSEHREVKTNGIMNEDTMHTLIEEALKDEFSEITFAFQGGEPTLAGIDYFKAFVSYVQQQKKTHQNIHYALQTNAYTIDEAWCSFFHEHDFLIGVSLDGYKENHNYFRLAMKQTTTYQRVMQSIHLLRKHEVQFNVLTVLSAQLAKHPQKLYRFYKEQKFDYVQLIPCLSGLDEPQNEFSLHPHLFASFYKTFYDLWLKDFQKNDYMSVTLFDNIIPMYRGVAPQQCGMLGHCALQYVVESDGSIYPCDFFVLDSYCAGNIKKNSIEEMEKSQPMINFLTEKKRTTPLCESCTFHKICFGNCKRLNTTYFNDTYCGYQDFLTHAYPSMIEIAKNLK